MQNFESVAARFGDLSSPMQTEAVSSQQSKEPTLTIEAQVYLINSLHSINAGLSRLQFTGVQLERLAARCDELSTTLTREQAHYVLLRTGLEDFHAMLEQDHRPDEYGPLALRTDLPKVGISEPEILSALVISSVDFLIHFFHSIGCYNMYVKFSSGCLDI